MFAAIANGGRIDGTQFLSEELVARVNGRPSLWPDRNIFVPLSSHLGYHSVPFPPDSCRDSVTRGCRLGGLGRSGNGPVVRFVHNRLLTRMCSIR